MRFTENGPSIPNELLQQQQQGNLVFFCGAGVSMPQLHSFWQLTEKTLDLLGVNSQSDIRKQLLNNLPLDQIFGLLQNEYKESIIDKYVHQLLSLDAPDLKNHITILKLSKNINKSPLIVTTNFDHLFEMADNSLTHWEAPLLPRHANLNTLSGIIYLHGRLNDSISCYNDDTSYDHNLVLTSSDFGRAYLAEGWATNFIRFLLEQKTIVLLGYCAEDPPVKYLLEGLKTSHLHPKTIYAFDGFDEENIKETEEKIKQKWSNLKVQPILFDKSEKVGKFSNLWTTLQAWADYADNLYDWQQSVIRMAQQSAPQDLKSYQRGQVATLISTIEGAKYFSEAIPPVPAEWLCVFDNQIRYSKPYKESYQPDAKEIDPLQLYGLDDDPPRIEEENWLKQEIPGINLLSTFFNEQYKRSESFYSSNLKNYLIENSRINYLLDWFINISHDPVALWWATSKLSLHHQVLRHIDRVIDQEQYTREEKIIWLWLLETHQQNKSLEVDIYDNSWYKFYDRLEADGWSTRSLRYLEKLLQPRFDLKLNSYGNLLSSKPKADTNIFSIIHPQLKWTRIYNSYRKIIIPDNQLLNVLRIITRAFEYALNFYHEPEFEYASYRDFVISLNKDKNHHDNDQNNLQQLFNWVTELLNKYFVISPEQARQLINTWPNNEPIFFNTLRLYIWLNTDLFTTDEVAVNILDLTEDYFFESDHRPDLLHTLQKYWSDFSNQQRISIEKKILLSKSQNQYIIGNFLGWLDQKGCSLSSESQTMLEKIRSASNWSKEAELTADQYQKTGTYRLTIEKMEGILSKLPLSQIIDQAEQHRKQHDFTNRTDYEPFIGLVETNPIRALSALIYQQKRNTFPIAYWQQLLGYWPKKYNDKTKRLLLICGLRLVQLPKSIFTELHTFIIQWIDTHFAHITDEYLNHFLTIWDTVLESIDIKEANNKSYILSSNRKESIKSIDYALDSPIGRLTKIILNTLIDIKLAKDQNIPLKFTKRFEKLLASKGFGADYACSILIQRIDYLHDIDPVWSTKVLIPLFKLNHPLAQSAWYSFLTTDLPSFSLFTKLKSHFNALYSSASWFKEGGKTIQNRFGCYITALIYYKDNNEHYLSTKEARELLQIPLPHIQLGAINQLSTILQNDEKTWTPFGKEFMDKVWPQEININTSETTYALIHIAIGFPDQFSDIVTIINPYLTVIDNPSMLPHEFARNIEGTEASLIDLYPLDVLKILDKVIPIKPSYDIYELTKILDKVVEQQPQVRSWESWRRLRQL